MKTFNILKKNRKYFEAVTGGYKCKILIDCNSDNLELGQHDLEVDDISVRSKFGTDLIFKLSAPVDQIKDSGVCTLKSDFYNIFLIKECRKLGGQWDPGESAWVFSGIVSDKVEFLDDKYNSDLVPIEVTFKDTEIGDKCPVYLAGFIVAYASGRDSGARLGQGVSLIDGHISSAGSVKNWCTRVSVGTVIRMQIPEGCLQDIDLDVDIKRL